MTLQLRGQRRRVLLAATALASCAPVAAQENGDWLLAISEGTSGTQSTLEVMARYEDLARFIGTTLKRKVTYFLARDFERLDDGVKRHAYHLVLARPSDYPARAIRDHGYRLVVTTRVDGFIRFIVPKDSALRTLRDLSGKRIAYPEAISYAARVATATLRDNGIDVAREKSLQYFRDQAAIGFMVESHLADVGAVMSYSGVGRDWEKKGGRILFDGPRQPYMPMVASPRVGQQDIADLRAALVSLDQAPAGQAILKRMGIRGFETRDTKELLALLQWLGV